MSESFSIAPTQLLDGPTVEACGMLESVQHQLLVPLTLEREVSYGHGFPSVTLRIVFNGERFEISRLVANADSEYVTTQFLTQLGLPRVMRKIVEDAIPNSEYWLQRQQVLLEPSDEYLLQLYWFEHISWGAPRQSVMEATGWSRANANWHLRRISRTYTLPGAQSNPPRRTAKPPATAKRGN